MGHTDYVLMDVLPVVVLYKNIAGNYENGYQRIKTSEYGGIEHEKDNRNVRI